MSRKIIGALTAVVALSCIVAGSTLLWPNTAKSTGSQAPTATADFDQVFASVTTRPDREYIPSFLTMIDFERVFAGENALPSREYVPVAMTAVDFERVFRSVTVAPRANTPPIREKLRNAGWKRLLGSELAAASQLQP